MSLFNAELGKTFHIYFCVALPCGFSVKTFPLGGVACCCLSIGWPAMNLLYLVSFISMSKAKYFLLQEQVLIQEKNRLSAIAFACDQV